MTEAIELPGGFAEEIVIAESLETAITEANRRYARWAAGCLVADLGKLAIPQEIQTIVCAVPPGDNAMTSECGRFHRPVVVAYVQPII